MRVYPRHMTTYTIGNPDTARALFNYFEGDRYAKRNRAPKGFNFLGAGCYRTAYLEKATNTVYKIGSYSANVSEAANSRRLRRLSQRKLGFEVRIPVTRTYRMPSSRYFRGRRWHGEDAAGYLVPECVVAQEYAPNAKYTDCEASEVWRDDVVCTCKAQFCYADALSRLGDWSGLDDIHSGNILVDDKNVFWFIDLAC